MHSALRPTAPIAADVLLPSDPGVALALAQDLLERPRMANHHHGLWGYSGARRAGSGELTIQATGLGGPSAAAVGAELIDLGARRLLRIGSCRARSSDVAPGETVVARAALASDGTSRALRARGAVSGDPGLTAALLAEAGTARAVTLAGTDVLEAAPGPGSPSAEAGPDAAVADLETAALFALGELRGVAVASMLVVAEADGDDPEGLEARLLALGRLASEALLEGRELVGDLVEPVLDRLEPS